MLLLDEIWLFDGCELLIGAYGLCVVVVDLLIVALGLFSSTSSFPHSSLFGS